MIGKNLANLNTIGGSSKDREIPRKIKAEASPMIKGAKKSCFFIELFYPVKNLKSRDISLSKKKSLTGRLINFQKNQKMVN